MQELHTQLGLKLEALLPKPSVILAYFYCYCPMALMKQPRGLQKTSAISISEGYLEI